ncbi:MAG: hypothetical protein ABWZ67_00720 [Solirubrobacteraceae bacterium]
MTAVARTGPRAAATASLDVFLTDRRSAARGALSLHGRSRAWPEAWLGACTRSSAARPRSATTSHASRWADPSAPARGDRRFGDPAWPQNWLLRRVLQGYLSAADAVDGVISAPELDWQTERQARFAAGNVLDAVAPTNFPWSNPTVFKAIVDDGGANLVRGAKRFAAHFAWPPRPPQNVDTSL